MPHDEPFDLEPIAPRKAEGLYLEENAANCAENTVQAHHYRLKPLMEWCETHGIENLDEITGGNVQEYRLWRQQNRCEPGHDAHGDDHGPSLLPLGGQHRSHTA